MRWSALAVSIGALLSGPVAMFVVSWIAPQPAWTTVTAFVLHYHPVQAVPFVLGFMLLGGFILFAAACHDVAPLALRPRTTAALVCTSVYAALVFTNYMLQVAFVPRLMHAAPEAVGILTMANPSSLGWFLEMFGYAALGIAMWLVAPLFAGGRIRDWIRRLLVLNAILSVAGAALTAIFDRWVFSTSGLVSFFLWNAVVIVSFGLIAAQPVVTRSEGELTRTARSRRQRDVG